ncbi:rCG23301, isoform CRA_d [Rattus norvegicus]|uniref:RCG23301, isoform CRA_d n=1 Tax=Rattus norvegicus TaxID=10116 RepID=A6JQ19_RAT|nr:rCG23301, isoform CRA_d [Rattus norvegicus]
MSDLEAFCCVDFTNLTGSRNSNSVDCVLLSASSPAQTIRSGLTSSTCHACVVEMEHSTCFLIGSDLVCVLLFLHAESEDTQAFLFLLYFLFLFFLAIGDRVSLCIAGCPRTLCRPGWP